MLKLTNIPDALPLGTEGLLEALDGMVPYPAFRPGDNPEVVCYAAGARDLVDWLIRRFEADRNPQEETAQEWYSADSALAGYIEGKW